MMKHTLPTYSDVVDASQKLKGIVRETRLFNWPELDEAVGRKVYAKCESLQLTGSFKLRGAYNRLCRLSDDERSRGVVAFSSGNHAQGVARAARLLGMPATIVMPKDTPKVKVDGVQRDGADIIFYDRFTESREEIAADLAERKRLVLVPSFDDFHVIAGQGSCGLEITNQWPEAEPPAGLICNVGGGGLMAGITLAVREHWPDIALWGAEPEDFDDHARSLKADERLGNDPQARSICDALLSPMPGELTFAINQPALSGIGRISDEDARNAVRFASRYLKLTVEPGGAASLAALLSGRIENLPEGPIVIVLTGGNIDPATLSEILVSAT